jgi:hypothetical protein
MPIASDEKDLDKEVFSAPNKVSIRMRGASGERCLKGKNPPDPPPVKIRLHS